MLKKLSLSLLIVILSMLIVVTVDTFLLTDNEQQVVQDAAIPQPKEQLLALDPSHPLIPLFDQSKTHPDKAQVGLERWLDDLERQMEPIEQIYMLWIERNIASVSGNTDQLEHFENRLWDLASNPGLAWLEAKLYIEQAVKLLDQDSYHQGIESIKLAIDIAQREGADYLLLEAYNTAGILHNALNQLKQSQLYFSLGLELGARFPESDYVGRFNNNLGLLFVHLEQWDTSIDYLLKAKDFFLTSNHDLFGPLPVIYFNLSYVYTELEDLQLSREYYQQAMKYIDQDSSRYFHIVSHKAKGRVDLLAGNSDEAEQSALRCLSDADIDKHPKQKGICLYLRAKALMQKGETAAAMKAINESVDVFEHISHQRWLIRSKLLLAQVLQAKGDFQQALQIYQKYHERERRQIIEELHALETAFEVRNVEKERDLLSVQNQLHDLESKLIGDRFKILELWLAVALVIAGWFITRSVVDRRQNKRLKAMSYLDPLTGGGNRRLYYQELRDPQIATSPSDYRLVVVDIDWFKHINDKYGHEVGDEVLTAVAQKLKSHVDEEELFIRWGGEEFLLLVKDRTDFRNYAQSLVNEINHAPLALSDSTLLVSVSIGVSESCRISDLRDGSTAFSTADKCLYKAKAHGRNQYVIAEDFAGE